MIWIFITQIALGVCAIVIALKIKQINDAQAKRFEVFERWMFESIYSINHKVLLPEEHEKPTINKKAKVHSPTTEAMYEFSGKKDDWFED